MQPARRWGKLAFRVAASLAVLGVVLLLVDRRAVGEAISRLRAGPWALTLCAFLILQGLSALKWRWFLALAGVHIPAATALRCHAAGLFANLCLPSLIGGDVLRAGLAMRATKDRTALVVASVVDRLADFAALAALSALAAPFVSSATAEGGGAAPLRALPIAAAVLVGGPVAFVVALRLVVRRGWIRRLPRKVGWKVAEVVAAIRLLRRSPARAALGWVFSLGIQALFVLVNAALGATLGLDLPLVLWFLLWPLAKVIAMLPLSFGGLGVREAAFAALVRPFGPESLAVAQSLVWQSVLIVGGLVCGAWWSFSSRGDVAEPVKA